jgi:hypothetical protein
MTGLVQVLCAYPQSTVEAMLSPISGVPAKHSFLPSIAEIREWLEDHAPRVSWAPRRALELSAPDMPRENRLNVAGLREKYGADWGLDKERHSRMWKALTVEELKAQGGLSDEQWNALPDAPLPVGMKKLPGTLVALQMMPEPEVKQ